MRAAFAKATEIPAGFWKWPHIDPVKEWADRRTGRMVVETGFLDLVERLRAVRGRPLIIDSGYRTPDTNQDLSPIGSREGAHVLAMAIDIRIYGAHALELIGDALDLGFTGVGVSQKGDAGGRFIHLDTAPSRDDAPRPGIWSY